MIATDERILELAHSFGLDPAPVEWVTAPAHIVYSVGSKGIPGRHAHWSFGKDFWKMKASYDSGMSRIYELVLPTKPAVAFLLDCNTEVEDLLVRAHVLGHSDFSNHNRLFATLPDNGHELAAARAERVCRYEEKYGVDRVERVITDALTVADRVVPEPYIGWREEPEKREAPQTDEWGALRKLGTPNLTTDAPRLMRRWVPTTDILQAIAHEGDALEEWERDLVSIVHEDALFFWPIRLTKIMNEGWACYWHQTIVRSLDLRPEQAMEFAKIHSGVTGAHGMHLNPYHLGLVIWRSIERTHGREAMFDIRANLSDVSFLRNYLIKELIIDEGMFTWEADGYEYVATAGVDMWELVRDRLCNQWSEMLPWIEVSDVDGGGARELHLTNRSGKKLDPDESLEVLRALKNLWKRPVRLFDAAGLLGPMEA